MKHILFLCPRSSCRSQMAEGWAKELLGRQPEPVVDDGRTAAAYETRSARHG